MSNFGRVLRLALRFRLTFAAVVVSALVVAVFWAANIGAIYPIVEVVLYGDSLQDWVRKEIDTASGTVAELGEEIDALRGRLIDAPPDERQRIEGEIARREDRVAAEEKALATYRWIKPAIDRHMPGHAFPTLVLVLVLFLCGTILKLAFLIANNISVARLAQRATLDLRKLFYRRSLRMDLAAFNDDGTADLMSRFTHDTETADLMSRFTHDTEHLSSGLMALFGKMVREPLKMAACLIGAAWICWRLLLVSLLLAPLAALLVHLLAKTLKRANRRAMEDMAQIYGTLQETFRGIKIVKAFCNEPLERKRFHDRNKHYYKKAMRIAGFDSLTRPLTELMGILAISSALMVGAYLVLSHETHIFGVRMCPRPLSVSTLLLFYGLLAGVADPVRKLSDVFTRIQRAAAAADRIYARFDREPRVRDPERPVPLPAKRRDLVFENVDFEYVPGQPILQDVNLEIPFGRTIAIVGPNGCGKSTLANLIPRFYDPTRGTIKLGGVPLADLRLRDLRREIGLVTQETLLFDDTIFNNIRYGRRQASREEVIEAARKAQAHEFITRELPRGYDTVAGDMGSRLSGGQRQRIALARAILRDPSIIILDEATSQVDLESEQAIQEVLEEFIRDRTAVIITHRLAVLGLADRIVVMQSGRILDVGTHEELLARCALYQRLRQIQFEAPGQQARDADSLAA